MEIKNNHAGVSCKWKITQITQTSASIYKKYEFIRTRDIKGQQHCFLPTAIKHKKKFATAAEIEWIFRDESINQLSWCVNKTGSILMSIIIIYGAKKNHKTLKVIFSQHEISFAIHFEILLLPLQAQWRESSSRNGWSGCVYVT